MFRRTIPTTFLIVLITSALAQFANGQPSVGRHWTSPLRPMQGTGRFLGLGYSSGYHWRSPGPNTDYYNPYNARNSERLAFNAQSPYWTNYAPQSVPTNGLGTEPLIPTPSAESNSSATKGKSEALPTPTERQRIREPQSSPNDRALEELEKTDQELQERARSNSVLNRT